MNIIKSTTGQNVEFIYKPDYDFSSDFFKFKTDKRWKNFNTSKLTYSEDFQQDLLRHSKDFTVNADDLIKVMYTLLKSVPSDKKDKVKEYVKRVERYKQKINEQAAVKLAYANKKKNNATQEVIIRNLKEYSMIEHKIIESCDHVVKEYTKIWKERTIKWIEEWAAKIEGKHLPTVLKSEISNWQARHNLQLKLEDWFDCPAKLAPTTYTSQPPYFLKKNYKKTAETQARNSAVAMVKHYAANLAFKTATFMKGKRFTLEVSDVHLDVKGLSTRAFFKSKDLGFNVKSQSVFASGVIKCEHYRYLLTFHDIQHKGKTNKKLGEKEMIDLIN